MVDFYVYKHAKNFPLLVIIYLCFIFNISFTLIVLFVFRFCFCSIHCVKLIRFSTW